jgi:polyribonucleotide nucleotidyltransferase
MSCLRLSESCQSKVSENLSYKFDAKSGITALFSINSVNGNKENIATFKGEPEKYSAVISSIDGDYYLFNVIIDNTLCIVHIDDKGKVNIEKSDANYYEVYPTSIGFIANTYQNPKHGMRLSYYVQNKSFASLIAEIIRQVLRQLLLKP